MTIEQIIKSTEPMLTPADIAEVFGSDPQSIRLSIQQDPTAFAPLQPVRVGNRIKFPRLRFIGWYYGEWRDEYGHGNSETVGSGGSRDTVITQW